MESSRNHFVPSHFPETSHQGLHALSLVEFICSHYPSNFVHVVEAKSEVFTADKAEHSLVKVVIVLLKEVERQSEKKEINPTKEKNILELQPYCVKLLHKTPMTSL